VNRPLTFEPRLTIEAATATATPEAIMAYSIAVAPLSQRKKRETALVIAVSCSFNIVISPSDQTSVVRCEISGSSAGGIG
jgi:hypothetical protein